MVLSTSAVTSPSLDSDLDPAEVEEAQQKLYHFLAQTLDQLSADDLTLIDGSIALLLWTPLSHGDQAHLSPSV